MHGCGWDSGRSHAPKRESADGCPRRLALRARRRSIDGVGAARPGAGRPWQPGHSTASRYALGAEGGGAARPGAYMCSPRYCARFACWLVGDLRMVPSFLGSQSCNQERAETRSRSERAARAKYIRSQLMII